MVHAKQLLRGALTGPAYLRAKDLFTRVRYATLYPLYAGTRFECPFCNRRFRSFLPYGSRLPILRDLRVVGAGYRDHARCPRCDSSDRERLVYLYLRRRADVFGQPARVLHVAPEKNLQRVLAMQLNSNYVSVDLASPLAMLHMDVRQMGFGDGTFDAVICNHVLQDVPNDHVALREILRVLKPGGWGILQVPLSVALERTVEDPVVRTPDERARQYGGVFHVRLYGRDYADRVAGAGFRVRRYSFVEEFGDEDVQRYGLLGDEDLYVAFKPDAMHDDVNQRGSGGIP